MQFFQFDNIGIAELNVSIVEVFKFEF